MGNPINDYGGPGGPGNIVSLFATNNRNKKKKGITAPRQGYIADMYNQPRGGPVVNPVPARSSDRGILDQLLNAPHGGPVVGSNSGMPPAPEPVDPIKTIRDYQAAARDIYAPSLDYLTGAESAAKQRGAGNDKQLANMYAGLVSSIAGDAGSIKGNYNDAINQIAQGTRETQNAVNTTYDSSANELAAMLQRLGIQAAAPDALKNNTRDEAFFKNMVGAGGQSTQNMLAQQRAGALEYNTAQQNISRQSGVDARANNQLSIEDTLRQIMGQKADVQTEINKQAMSMQSSAVDQQLKSMQNDRDWQYKQAQLELDKSKLALQAAGQQSQPKADDPWTKLQMLAGNIYPNQESTSNAVKAIRDTVTRGAQQGQTWKSPNEFINAVLSRNQGANDSAQLVQLATYLYQQLYGR